jgi:dUTP pyrophosphatase
MKLKIQKIDAKAKLPSYAHEGDAGMDLYSLEAITILPGERKPIRTGISMAIPRGCVGLIWDKSGLSLKEGLTTLGGVIDSGYRGEVLVSMANISNKRYTIEAGHKIAQMLIQKVESPTIVEVQGLNTTKRGRGGFGSSGV